MCAARYRLRSFPKGVAAGLLVYEVYETRRIPSRSALVLAPREDCVIEDDERHEQEQDDCHDDGDTLLHGSTSIRR